jgi:colicin import membrane protein
MSFALPRNEVTAGLLAAAVHGFFVLLLVVGVSWQIHDARPIMAELWPALPEPPRPEPPPMPKPSPAREAKPQPAPVSKAADIALEKKKREEKLLKEKQLQKAEEKRREEAMQKQLQAQREAAQKEAERLKREQDKKRLEALQREEAEMQRRMLEQSAAEISQLKAKAAAEQRASEIEKTVARYKDMISAKIRGNTRLPENLPGNPEVEFRLSVLPTGEIAKITLTKSSGIAAYDQAVQRGIEKSSPLPLPPDTAAAANFRDLDLKHKARE